MPPTAAPGRGPAAANSRPQRTMAVAMTRTFSLALDASIRSRLTRPGLRYIFSRDEARRRGDMVSRQARWKACPTSLPPAARALAAPGAPALHDRFGLGGPDRPLRVRRFGGPSGAWRPVRCCRGGGHVAPDRIPVWRSGQQRDQSGNRVGDHHQQDERHHHGQVPDAGPDGFRVVVEP